MASTTPPDDIDSTPALGGRYVLGEVIGQGASATVHLATDRISGQRAAVKRLHTVRAAAARRFAREIATLRMLDVRGAVRLLDAGEDEDGPWLAMEHVAGAPFPGRPTPVAWSELRTTVASLLATLSGLHAYGLVHRDLSPNNVIVDPAGRPTVVDFGLARALSPADGTVIEVVVGTHRYIAPEAWTGAPPAPSVDLFAVGVLVAEALLGVDLSEGCSVPAWVGHARSGELRRRVLASPAVTGDARVLLDRLLDPDPAQRAAELADPAFAAWIPPALLRDPGPPAPAVAAVRAGGRARWTVDPGRAASTAVEAARVALVQAGGRAVVAPEGRAPLESLERAGWSPPATAAWREVRGSAISWARAQGAWVIDEARAPDGETAAVLAQVGVLRVGVAQRVGRGVSAAALRDLFAGPDRLLHLREDAAAALHARTGGHPAWVRRQVEAWLRSGAAAVDGDRIRLSPGAARRLLAHADGLVDDPPGSVPPDLDPPALRLLAALAFGRPGIPAAVAAAAAGAPAWRASRTLATLARRGLAHRGAEGWRDLRAAAAVAALSAADRQEVRQALLAHLPSGHPARWRLALLEGDADGIGTEALATVHRWREEGRLGPALALAGEALLLTRLAGEPAAVVQCLEALAGLALASESTGEVRSAAAALEPLRRGRAEGDRLRQLVEGVQAVLEGAALAWSRDPRGALALLQAPAPSPTWESWRVGVRVRAWLDLRELDRAAAEVDGLLAALGATERSARGRALGLRGLVRYHQGAFPAAARDHGASARLREYPEERVSAWLNQASALLEAGEHAAAAAQARRALRLAEPLRFGPFVVRAAWLARAAAYREGADLDADEEWVAVARWAVDERLLSLVALQEAAFAWRRGDPGALGRLAETTRTHAERAGVAAVAALAAALVADARSGAELLALAERSFPPAVAAQIAVILPEGTPGRGEALARLLPKVPPARRGRWLEVARLPLTPEETTPAPAADTPRPPAGGAAPAGAR